MKTVTKKLLSILLVAIMLVSMMSFAAFADDDDDGSNDDSSSQTGGTNTDDDGDDDDDDDDDTVSQSGEDHQAHGTIKYYEAKEATCTAVGYSQSFYYCSECGKCYSDEACTTYLGTIAELTISATGHDYDETTGECKNGCGSKITVETPADCTVTFIVYNEDGSEVGYGTKEGCHVGSAIGYFPSQTPSRDGYTFLGWYVDGDTSDANNKVTGSGTIYKESWGENAVIIACWEENTYVVQVIGVKNSVLSTGKVIYKAGVSELVGDRISTWLDNEVKDDIENWIPDGYTWDGIYYNGSLSKVLGTDSFANKAYYIYVNVKPATYKLYFDYMGGTAGIASKDVTYGNAVGTLPSPTKTVSGIDYVFINWVDADGNVYTKDTVYNVKGNTYLYAQWDKEANVWLYIYLNGNTSSANRILKADGYVVDSQITRSAVESYIKTHYNYTSLTGLFDDSTWSDYLAGTNKTGSVTVTIDSDHTNHVYVMVNGTNKSVPSDSSSNSGSSSSSGSNPKTGDYIIAGAATLLVVSGAALTTVTMLRKKKIL